MIKVIVYSLLVSFFGNDEINDWKNAGVEAYTYKRTTNIDLKCPDDQTCDQALKTVLENRPAGYLIINVPEGEWYFNSTIRLPGGVQLKGKARKTRLIFELDERDHCISISGSAMTREGFSAQRGIKRGEQYVELRNDNAFIPGDLIRVVFNDTHLVTRDWGRGQVGQINKVVEVQGNKIFVESAWRMDFDLNRNLHIHKMNPVKDVSITDIDIVRRTSSSRQVSNIYVLRAHRVEIDNVYSDSCVYAHVDVRESRNIRIQACSFFEAHSYGEGGRAYGVILHSGTAEALVVDNAFSRLRHAMIVQSGANGNAFAYNSSKNVIASRSVFGMEVFHTLSGDMVVHGNYPYLNLFEGNSSHMGIIDNAHGRNGHQNVFFRNTIAPHGITITNSQSHSQVIIGNQTSGLNWFSARDHLIEGNSHQGEWNREMRSLVFDVFPKNIDAVTLSKMGNGGDPEFKLPAERLHR